MQDFLLLHRLQTGSGAHPASYTMDIESSSSGVKRQEREADHSPPSSAKVKNGEAVTPVSRIVFMAQCSIN
jgi:hypothetical protein